MRVITLALEGAKAIIHVLVQQQLGCRLIGNKFGDLSLGSAAMHIYGTPCPLLEFGAQFTMGYGFGLSGRVEDIFDTNHNLIGSSCFLTMS